MSKPDFEEDGPRLILHLGGPPLPVVLLILVFSGLWELWFLHEIATQHATGAAPQAFVPLGIGALVLAAVFGFGLFAQLDAELILDPSRGRVDFHARNLLRRQHLSWPLATLPVPQIHHDSGNTDSLPSCGLRFTLPRPIRAATLSFHFPGTYNPDAHLAREVEAAQALQIRVAALIEAARGGHSA